jgi:hypothetical protein
VFAEIVEQRMEILDAIQDAMNLEMLKLELPEAGSGFGT